MDKAVPSPSSPGYRAWLATLDKKAYREAARKEELRYFAATTSYCSRCASPLEDTPLGSRRCPECGMEIFPRLNPAIVVLVTRGEAPDDEALLVRPVSFRTPNHALVAGFVEAGENLEQCVAREVMEETSLKISDIRYFGSQAWPFPSQLMVAFTARYREGEIRFADGEIGEGGWFRRDSLPEIPPPPSLTRRLIDRWIKGEL